MTKLGLVNLLTEGGWLADDKRTWQRDEFPSESDDMIEERIARL